MGQNTGVAAP